jgi:hypothetical protein
MKNQPPCKIPCPKCGSRDISRKTRIKGEVWHEYNERQRANDLVFVGKIRSKARRDCVQSWCRECAYAWEAPANDAPCRCLYWDLANEALSILEAMEFDGDLCAPELDYLNRLRAAFPIPANEKCAAHPTRTDFISTENCLLKIPDKPTDMKIDDCPNCKSSNTRTNPKEVVSISSNSTYQKTGDIECEDCGHSFNSPDDEALTCECGSVRWCLLKSGNAECHECQNRPPSIFWKNEKSPDAGEKGKANE